ncbi:MAG TPA: bifunctional riboflavin kinase/FAD synthetase [Thermoleophilia bacterium]
MRFYDSLNAIPDSPASRRVVAIGVFDGVHRGHQRIILETLAQIEGTGGIATAVTFEPHPEAVLRPYAAPRLLTTLTRKAELLEALGLEELVAVRFDREFSQLSPLSFCRIVLSDRLGACLVLVGENFRFGHQGCGSVADLRGYGKDHGFSVEAVPLAEESGEIISSTRIRMLIKRGRVAEAARLLGRPHRLAGVVVEGAQRGRELGAPTANLAVERGLAIPRLGVYVTRTVFGDGTKWPSVTSVGTNPTFEVDRRVRIETLLLGFAGTLYGSNISVDFLEKIRDQLTFPDAGSLTERIYRDAEIARGYFDGRADLL